MRYDLGFNTRRKTWEALHIVQAEYLLPMIDFVKAQPWYSPETEQKMVIVFMLEQSETPLMKRLHDSWNTPPPSLLPPSSSSPPPMIQEAGP